MKLVLSLLLFLNYHGLDSESETMNRLEIW